MYQVNEKVELSTGFCDMLSTTARFLAFLMNDTNAIANKEPKTRITFLTPMDAIAKTIPAIEL